MLSSPAVFNNVGRMFERRESRYATAQLLLDNDSHTI